MVSLLHSRGYRVVAVADVSPEARDRAAALTGAPVTADAGEAVREAGIVLLTTPDDRIEAVCAGIARSAEDLSGKVFVHMSGALPLAVLEPARRAGAAVVSVHPLQTFPDLNAALEALPGSTFGVTCERGLEPWARGLVEDLGGRMQLVADADRVSYHAAAVVACNFLAIVERGALALAKEAGFTDEGFALAFAPLMKATVDNIARFGPAGALTGPLARGDIETIGRHLEALDRSDGELAAMYRAVCLYGLGLVSEIGETDTDTINRMRDLLG